MHHIIMLEWLCCILFQVISLGIRAARFVGSDYLALYDGGSEKAELLANLSDASLSVLTTIPKTEKPAHSQSTHISGNSYLQSYTSCDSQVVIAIITDGCHISTQFELEWNSLGKSTVQTVICLTDLGYSLTMYLCILFIPMLIQRYLISPNIHKNLNDDGEDECQLTAVLFPLHALLLYLQIRTSVCLIPAKIMVPVLIVTTTSLVDVLLDSPALLVKQVRMC